MLRDNILVVLEDVILRCAETASGYLAAAEEVGDPDLTTLFSLLASERRSMANRLTAAAHLNGDENHRDRESSYVAIHRWMARFRAAFTVDRRIILLEECERAEQFLGESMARALGAPLSSEARQLLVYFEADVTATRGRLQAIRVRLRAI